MKGFDEEKFMDDSSRGNDHYKLYHTPRIVKISLPDQTCFVLLMLLFQSSVWPLAEQGFGSIVPISKLGDGFKVIHKNDSIACNAFLNFNRAI